MKFKNLVHTSSKANQTSQMSNNSKDFPHVLQTEGSLIRIEFTSKAHGQGAGGGGVRLFRRGYLTIEDNKALTDKAFAFVMCKSSTKVATLQDFCVTSLNYRKTYKFLNIIPIENYVWDLFKGFVICIQLMCLKVREI